MVGSNYLYAFAPNIRARKGRRRRHVARVVRDSGELGWIRIVSTANDEPRSGGLQTAVGDLEIALPCFLPFTRARFSCQRPHCLDTSADRRCVNHLHPGLASGPTL